VKIGVWILAPLLLLAGGDAGPDRSHVTLSFKPKPHSSYAFEYSVKSTTGLQNQVQSYTQEYQELVSIPKADQNASEVAVKIKGAKITAPLGSGVARAASSMENTLDSVSINYRVDPRAVVLKYGVNNDDSVAKKVVAAMQAMTPGFMGLNYTNGSVGIGSKWSTDLDLTPVYKALDPNLPKDLELGVPILFSVDAIEIRGGRTLVTLTATGQKQFTLPLHTEGGSKATPMNVRFVYQSTSIVDAADGMLITASCTVGNDYESETLLHQENIIQITRA
jgi:hypothetical protein